APVGARMLRVHLAATAREVQHDELHLERAGEELREVDELLERGREAVHREEGETEQGVVPEARRDDARDRAELAPRLFEPRDAPGAVAAGVQYADRARDERVGRDPLLGEVLHRADLMRAECGAAA